jgi:hypothetical protein
MFLRFLWLVIHFREGMFGVLYSLSDNFYRFGHSLIFLVEVEQPDNCREGLSSGTHRAFALAAVASSICSIRQKPSKIHSKLSDP